MCCRYPGSRWPKPMILSPPTSAGSDCARPRRSTATLDRDKRVGAVSLNGMATLKARLSGYFVRSQVPRTIVDVGAHEEWHELDLWERWTARAGNPTGFQAWLSEDNPNFPGQKRRDTLYDDLVGIREQLDDRT